MKAGKRTKIFVDICMMVFMVLSFVRWEGDPTFHLIVGAGCALFFGVHMFIHRKWMWSVTKSCVTGKMKPALRGKYIVDMLLLAVWGVSIVTGVLAIWMDGLGGVHGWTARIGLALVVVHIVQHRGQIRGYCRRRRKAVAAGDA
ncbi:MAG: hypothetical protein FWE08_08045 [Oscillospiraceae bacterium]|nr:hypothetical protein [Oscillospiraceae bacterium]